MKNIIAVSLIVGTIALTALTGCNTMAPGTPTSNPVNLNPIGYKSLNPPLFNGEAITLAMSQLPQFGTLDVVGPGISFHVAKNMPPGYVYQPVTPLTADEALLCEHAFIADVLYGMRNDHSSWDMTLVPSNGWTVTLHTAYPPSALNVTTVTNTSTTGTITIPGITSTNVTQVLTK